jgi:hypothetical protein
MSFTLYTANPMRKRLIATFGTLAFTQSGVDFVFMKRTPSLGEMMADGEG